MMSSFERRVGENTLSMETGKLAQQANGSVVIRYGDSMALVTATMSSPREGIDFFPLTIDFEERMYARGKIPGSFFRREGRPSTDAILTDRLTDRPLRPLFPKGFRNEVQVIVTALSADQENPLDLMTIIGASTALGISDIPFDGPVAATRIGYIDGEFVVNPTYQQLDVSALDLVVAGTRAGVAMMEAGANELSDGQILDAIKLAQDTNLGVIDLQDEIIRAVGIPKVGYEAASLPEGIESRVAGMVDGRLTEALAARDSKAAQAEQLSALKGEVVDGLKDQFEAKDVAEAFEAMVEKEFRTRILEQGARPDGRGLKDMRPLSAEVGVLPRAHGTGLFERGETQALGVATLGGPGDAQRLDNLSPNETKRFMFHYNFPPYSTGETRFIGSPKRRDIGHGALAERAITPVLPSDEDFPYTLRLVSEVLSSNGSTSMASTCAGILALMDAGVPIKAPVAGISIGLITGDNGRFATLTDIQGMEDHFGDMDFKVAGTAEGITAIQLDIKVGHIGFDIIEAALAQAKEARLTILDAMRQAIDGPREEMSPFAPRMTKITIPVDKIGALIGPGGKTIRGIVEETKATVDVQDDGTVVVGSADGEASKRAIEIIERLTKVVKIGEIYTGKVVRIMNFGAFVELVPGTDGMVHISELADYRVPTVEDVVKLGEEITVVVKDIDPSGKVSLSRRMLLKREDGEASGEGGGEERREQGGQDRGRPGGSGGYRPRNGPPGRSDGPRSGGGGPRSGGGWRGERRGGGRPGDGPRGDGPRQDPPAR